MAAHERSVLASVFGVTDGPWDAHGCCVVLLRADCARVRVRAKHEAGGVIGGRGCGDEAGGIAVGRAGDTAAA